MSTLVQLLQDSVERFSGAAAFVWRDSTWSYGDLDDARRAVAEHLAHCRLQPGDRIALLFRNCPHYVALYYGVLSAGCVVVPLNSHERGRLLARQVEHSGACMVFGESSHPEWNALTAAVPAATVTIGIPVEGSNVAAGAFAAGMRALGVAPAAEASCGAQSLACILYTSGTTGHPKGVMLSHGNLVANTLGVVRYLGLTERDSVLSVLPFPFSYGNSVLHTHLAAGARIVLEEHLAFPRVILERMQAERVTGFSGVPSTFSVLLSRFRLDAFDLSSLRYVTQSGGPMPRSLLRKLCDQLPHAQIFAMYGQTEATSRLTYLPPHLLESKFGSVGAGLPGIAIRILGADGKELCAGETGEICARGPNVMLGYWKDPAMTASVLKDGWLHTGDLGHKDDEGFVFIDGRVHEMIKVGAFRVSPHEVEEVLAEIPGVQEAAVTHVADALLGQAVKAVIVRADGESPDALAVRAHCRARLATYKVPREIEFVTALPRTSSGKVQRFKLSQPGVVVMCDTGKALNSTVFAMDCAAEVERISARLREVVSRDLRRRGLIIAMSGGIDSSVCAALAVQALRSSRVYGLLLPERDSSGASTERGKLLAEHLGIAHETLDIAPTLEAIGCYRTRDEAMRRVFPAYASTWKSKIVITGGLEGRLNHFQIVVQKPDGQTMQQPLGLREYLEIVSATNYKQRIRKTIEYFHADRLNYAVVGTPNRLEYDQGFFVKNGDGSADVKPIAHLYKSQVYALARHMRLPEEICSAIPSTDTYSLAQGQDEFYFGLPYEQMDLALWAYNHEEPAACLANATDLTTEQAQFIYRDIEAKRRATRYLHMKPVLIEPVCEIVL